MSTGLSNTTSGREISPEIRARLAWAANVPRQVVDAYLDGMPVRPDSRRAIELINSIMPGGDHVVVRGRTIRYTAGTPATCYLSGWPQTGTAGNAGPGGAIVISGGDSTAFVGGDVNIMSGAGPVGAGFIRAIIGSNANASWAIERNGDQTILSGTAANGGSPVTVGPITHNNMLLIHYNEVITTPAPDVAGATVIGGIRCEFNGQAVFIPLIADST